MFIEKMSSEELFYEYDADLPDIQKQTLRFDQSEYVTRYLWKHRKNKVVTITKIFTSTRGNRYIGVIIYKQTGCGKSKEWLRSTFHVGLMQTFKGLAVVAFYNKSQQALKYTAHFFSRYKMRLLEVCDWKTRNQLTQAKSIEDIAAIYVSRNIGITWIETESVFRDKVHIFAPINDGVTLLQWDKSKKLLQANTFVTNDMLDEKQLTMVGYAKTYFSMNEEERSMYKFPDFITEKENSLTQNKQL